MSGHEEALAFRMGGLSDREFRTIVSLARLSSHGDVYARRDTLAKMMNIVEDDAIFRVQEVCERGLVGPLMLCLAVDPATDERVMTFVGKFEPQEA